MGRCAVRRRMKQYVRAVRGESTRNFRVMNILARDDAEIANLGFEHAQRIALRNAPRGFFFCVVHLALSPDNFSRRIKQECCDHETFILWFDDGPGYKPRFDTLGERLKEMQ